MVREMMMSILRIRVLFLQFLCADLVSKAFLYYFDIVSFLLESLVFLQSLLIFPCPIE